MKIIEKPWGHEEILFTSEKYTVKRLFMKAGHRCSLQYHEKKNETVFILEGELEFTVGPSTDKLEKRVMKAGDYTTIAPGIVHRMGGIKDSYYLEASTSELDDVIRLKDDYSR